ncbi:NADPH-dependent FMN reductase [Paeniroseomonas aquatica]|uniref:NADPH-dependent FMN reductase n=1 Tax=Paeniroseomonas aquatica TaxID=373043 RepID=UPI00360A8D4C
MASYSAGRLAGARANFVWHGILSEMGMVVISSTLMVGPITKALDEGGAPVGEGARRWPAPSRASPRISTGGRRPAAGSASRGRRPTDRCRSRAWSRWRFRQPLPAWATPSPDAPDCGAGGGEDPWTWSCGRMPKPWGCRRSASAGSTAGWTGWWRRASSPASA